MKRKLSVVLVILFMIMFSIRQVSLATSGSTKIILTPSKSTVKPGSEFTITVSQENQGGIEAIESKLEYDSNIFELSQEDPEMGSEWRFAGAVDMNKFDAYADNKIETGDIFKITFKVKDNAPETSSEIKFSDILFYKDDTNSINVEDKSVQITISNTVDNENNNNNGQSVSLSKIEVATKPSKLEYTKGEKFSTNGMVIKATYSDGTSKDITDYTYSPNGELTTENKLITISYTENGVTKTTTQAITVNSVNSSNNNNTTNMTNNTNTANNTSNKTTNKTNSTNTTKDNTTTSSSLPKTGTTTKYILLIVAGLMGIAFVSYKEYKKYKGI